MPKKTTEEKVEHQLWNLICNGSGDGDTIRALAKKITKIVRDNG